MISKGQLTTYKVFCNLLLIVAALINLASSSLSIHIVVKGIRTRKKLSPLHADMLLFSSWMLKVKNNKNYIAYSLANKMQMEFSAHFLYYASLCLIKAAYLFFYTDLYKRIETSRRIALWAARIFWVGGYIVGISLIFTWCLPFEGNWSVYLWQRSVTGSCVLISAARNFRSENPHCPAIFTITVLTVLSSINIGTDLCSE